MKGALLLLMCSAVLLWSGCQQAVPSQETLPAESFAQSAGETVLMAELQEVEAPVYLHLVAVGDNLIHYPIYDQAFRNAGADYDFTPSYAAVQEMIYAADIAFLNQEVPTAGQAYGLSSYPLFNSPQELARDMAQFMGFDVINQASNHSIDKGIGGLETTYETWSSQGVLSLGCWREPENGGVRFMERDGLVIAFVAYTYGLNGIELADWQGWHIGMLDDREAMRRDILLAQETADLVIVSLHWGYEGWLIPNDEQIELAAYLASLNVDLIIGHHPHVIQPVAELQRADGRLMPVFYSLGNFISNQIEAENMLGGLATVELVKDASGAYIRNPTMLPLVTHYTAGFINTYVYPLADYSQELAAQHGIRAFDSRFTLAWLRQLWEEVVAAEYRVEETK